MSPLPPGLIRSTAARDPIDLHLVEGGATLPETARSLAGLSGFEGEIGQVLVTPNGVWVGAGDGREPFALGVASASLKDGHFRLVSLPDGLDPALAALGWALGAYRFERYKSTGAPPSLIVPEGVDADRLASEVEAVRLVRDLVNTPAEHMGPDALADAISETGAAFDAKVEVTKGSKLEKEFPLIHTVGRAAAIPPRLVDLNWGRDGDPAITLVGKGVCFDSGGLDIKGASGMALMKKDMGGAANALGLARLIMAAELPVRLRLLVPAVENAISGNAYRPGDVYTSRKGLTVEISNTDAEGRLVLADALALAVEAKPQRIISLATLTGAARVALGPDLAPIYSTDAAFRDRVIAVGERNGDPLWPMPLWKRYDDYLSSQIADVNHASPNSFAGSVTAALFLNRFVPPEIPYTHLDIFAWVPKARPGRPAGGEAMGIRSLFDSLLDSVAGRKQQSKRKDSFLSARRFVNRA